MKSGNIVARFAFVTVALLMGVASCPTRISAVQSFGSKRSVESYAGRKSAICQRLAERYRALLEANPQASFRKYFYAASPLDILAAAKSAGVTIAQPGAQFDEYSRRKISNWP